MAAGHTQPSPGAALVSLRFAPEQLAVGEPSLVPAVSVGLDREAVLVHRAAASVAGTSASAAADSNTAAVALVVVAERADVAFGIPIPSAVAEGEPAVQSGRCDSLAASVVVPILRTAAATAGVRSTVASPVELLGVAVVVAVVLDRAAWMAPQQPLQSWKRFWQ